MARGSDAAGRGAYSRGHIVMDLTQPANLRAFVAGVGSLEPRSAAALARHRGDEAFELARDVGSSGLIRDLSDS